MNEQQPPSANGNYLESLSLHCAPFADEIDGRFFYGGTALMQRLDLLSHLTQFGDAVILVAGPEGSGKTTMLRRFVGDASKRWRLCLLDAADFERFPRSLADSLGVEAADSETEVLNRWSSQSGDDRLLVIVIDNAGLLDESAFRRLCTLFNQPGAERLRLVMFGTPDAQQRLKQALEKNALSCTTQFLEVPRLSEEETASYLMYRLAVAGYSGESPFTATEIRAICKAADGRPAAINRLAHQALQERQARLKSRKPGPVRRLPPIRGPVWGGAALLVLVLAFYLGWQRFYPERDEVPLPRASLPAMQERPLELPERTPREPTGAPPDAEPPALVALNQPSPATSAGMPEPPLATESGDEPSGTDRVEDLPRPPGSDSRAPRTGAATTGVAALEPKPVTKDSATPPVDTPTTPRQDDANRGEREEITAADNEAAAIPQAPAAKEAETSVAPKPAEPAATAPEASAIPAPKTAGSAVATALPHREDWLLQQPETAFSLQLLGSRSEQSLLDFIRSNRLDLQRTAYYRGRYKGSDWYVLLYGSYPDRKAALAARSTLPARVRKGKPWPRSLKAVQQAIREMR
ncbi:MAG TPA: hypothetical protein ENK05_06920 [Gammaproteobacteria bacterium]|nr:hypothetical protein [Gammaproteobacteria bacterium]